MNQNIFTGELEANRLTVQKLLGQASEGVLRVPPFQRPLRWRRADHLLLLDSLYRGYPVGTLLLWRRPASGAEVVFGDFAKVATARPDALWIVDGQQRITSIVGCLLRPDGTRARRSSEFAFYFDLEKDQFVADTGQRPNPRLVPVNRLRDSVSTSMWAREMGVSMDDHRRAEEIGARIRRYEIPAYVTYAEDDEVLRTIFDRANTAGKQMRREEVFEALNKGLKPSDSPDGLTERLQTVLYALNFGRIEDTYLQRALVCLAGYNPKTVIPEELRAPGAATQWEARTAEGLRRTIGFLRDEAHIPHASALPYHLPLILLPRFFHLFPSPSERSLELLVRWVWRGIAGQTHMATNQQFNPHYKALKAGTEDEVVQAMLRLVVGAPPASMPSSDVYNLRGMKTKLELAILQDLGPRALESGTPLLPVDVFEPREPEQSEPHGAASSAQSASVGSAPKLRLHGLPTKDRANQTQVAAHFLHPLLPGGDRAFADALRGASDEVLSSHAIGPELVPLVRSGAWDALVEARASVIRSLVADTINRLARWGEDDDGPPIDALEPEPDDDEDGEE